jgi:hypothetical protein
MDDFQDKQGFELIPIPQDALAETLFAQKFHESKPFLSKANYHHRLSR